MHVQTRPMTMIDNARLGMLLFIAAEVMFFAGLVGAYLVFRMGGEIWPPPGQPRLPVLTTALNTLFLLASGWTIRFASRMVRRQDAICWEKATLILGLVFLVIQGLEWWRLMQYGLTVEIGPYGFMSWSVFMGFMCLVPCSGGLRMYGGRPLVKPCFTKIQTHPVCTGILLWVYGLFYMVSCIFIRKDEK
jgi:heme/copper-type cytochrome/quinol oxidase subunit 3